MTRTTVCQDNKSSPSDCTVTDVIRAACCKQDSYPDDDREERPAARGQVDIGVQKVLVQVGVW